MRTLRKQAPKGMGPSSPDPICATAPFGAHRRQGQSNPSCKEFLAIRRRLALDRAQKDLLISDAALQSAS